MAKLFTWVAFIAAVATILGFLLSDAEKCRLFRITCPVAEVSQPSRLPTADPSEVEKTVPLFVAPPEPVEPAIGPAPNPKSVELAYWQSIAESDDIALYEEYLRRYPSGDFAEVARSKIRKLRAALNAPAPASAPPPAASLPKPTPFVAEENLVGTWRGHYYCRQGLALATVEIRENGYSGLGGVFSFRPPPGGRGLAGMYEIGVDRRGEEIVLRPIRWIQRPPGWVMIPASVRADGPDRLFGRVLDAGCGEIELIRSR
jgi:hypothetical protein